MSDITLKMGMCVKSGQMLTKFYRNSNFHFDTYMDISYFSSLVVTLGILFTKICSPKMFATLYSCSLMLIKLQSTTLGNVMKSSKQHSVVKLQTNLVEQHPVVFVVHLININTLYIGCKFNLVS